MSAEYLGPVPGRYTPDMLLLCLAAAAQTVTGGFGTGLFANQSALGRLGWMSTASIEVTDLTDDVPWLGFGADAVAGFQPRFCTTCNVKGTLRIGAGPAFKRGGGLLLAGARASILGDVARIRPFAVSRAQLPVSRMVFRPFLWAEGFRATEFGVGLEIGFRVRDQQLVVRPAEEPDGTGPEAPSKPADVVPREGPADDEDPPAEDAPAP